MLGVDLGGMLEGTARRDATMKNSQRLTLMAEENVPRRTQRSNV